MLHIINVKLSFLYVTIFLMNSLENLEENIGHPTLSSTSSAGEYYSPHISGGAREDRTPDPLRAKQVLSQLSYGPIPHFTILVGLDGLEPSTSPLSGVRSNHLSYRPPL